MEAYMKPESSARLQFRRRCCSRAKPTGYSRASCVGHDLICNVAEEGTRAGSLLEELIAPSEWSYDST
jgi:hypothetical protein